MTTLRNSVAIITGAADGIGAGIAKRMASDGARLVLADVDAEKLEVLAEQLRAKVSAELVTCATDVSNREQVRSMVALATATYGRIDCLVNNAWGGGTVSRLEDKTDELLQHGLNVAYFGSFWAMQAAFPTMKAQAKGSIVNLCSLNGVNAHMGTAEYNGAKEALRALTRTAAREWAPYGIRANAVCPGAKSAAFRSMAKRHLELEAMADAANPMGRLGDPETDIAPVIAFLASDDSRYLTGNTLFVDGGSHINGVQWVPDFSS